MPIQFRCTNIVAYDAASEGYVRCNAELTAADNEVAKFVECPTCHGRVLVPTVLPAATLSAPVASSAASPPRSPSTPGRTAATEPPLPGLTFSSFGSKHRCSRCGGAVDDQFRCVVCQYQNILKLDTTPIRPDEIQAAGCQLWLSQKLTHGIAAPHLIFAMHSLVAILLIILVTTAFGLGGSAAWIVLTIVAALAGLYVYIVLETRRIATRPPGQLNWWQRGTWNWVLNYYRVRKWRPLNSALRWQVLDLRGQKIDDRTLTSIPDLMRYHVLDLEGTQLSDAGLLKLQGMKQLQRIVARHTQVTPDAVFQVQQKLPQVWIWS